MSEELKGVDAEEYLDDEIGGYTGKEKAAMSTTVDNLLADKAMKGASVVQMTGNLQGAAGGRYGKLGGTGDVEPGRVRAKKEWVERKRYEDEMHAGKNRQTAPGDPLGNIRVPELYSTEGAVDLEEQNEITKRTTIATAELVNFAREIMPTTKPEMLDNIYNTNLQDLKLAYSIGAGNVKNIAPHVLRQFAARGLEIGHFCKFGKSKKLYKSIKVPKVLFGIRAINPPSPAIFIMRFLSFIWRLMATGINQPPGSFLRIGMAFFKGLCKADAINKTARGKYIGSKLTKPMLIEGLKAFDNLAPGLLMVYEAYQEDNKVLTVLKRNAREDAAIARDYAKEMYDNEVKDVVSAMDAFSAAVATASALLAPNLKVGVTPAVLSSLLGGFTDGPKNFPTVKVGRYQDVQFGGPTTARKTKKMFRARITPSATALAAKKVIEKMDTGKEKEAPAPKQADTSLSGVQDLLKASTILQEAGTT